MNRTEGFKIFMTAIIMGIMLLPLALVSCAQQPPAAAVACPATPPQIGEEQTDMIQTERRSIPEIDATAPSSVETATFSLG